MDTTTTTTTTATAVKMEMEAQAVGSVQTLITGLIARILKLLKSSPLKWVQVVSLYSLTEKYVADVKLILKK